jgi:Zn-finger nucleic acid-binding protein
MTIEGVDLDFCSACKGIWFDKDELAFMTELASDLPHPQAARTEGKPTEFECPRCETPLEELRYVPARDLLLDRCPGCQGVWLDKGELKKVEDIAARIGSPESKILRAAKQLKDKGYSLLGIREA